MANQAWIAAAASVVLVAILETWAGPVGIAMTAGLLSAWGCAAHRSLLADWRRVGQQKFPTPALR